MASVALDQCYIHLASDLTQYVACDTAGETVPVEVDGEVRRYANGRYRMVRTPGSTKSYQLQFTFVDRADLLTLESWVGREVLVRDEVGRKNWGAFFAAPVQEQGGLVDPNGEAGGNIQLTITVVTHSEVV